MKRSFPINPLSLLTLILGATGLGLRFWLFSAIDDRGLFPHWHVAQILLYVLTLLALVLIFLSTMSMEKEKCTLRVKSGNTRKVGAVAGALGLGISSVLGLLDQPAGLSLAVCALGVIAAVFLVILGFRPNGRLSFPVLCGLTVYFMLFAVSKAQYWGTLPQLQHFLFPLLALVFLVLTGYCRCELSVRAAVCRRFVFFNQGALFFCCLSLNTENWPFYLGAVCWLACDFSSVQLRKKEA